MSVFFNGRIYTTPTTVSAVNDSALANQNLAQANNLAILGPSAGGKPNTPIVFGNPTDAIAQLISGDLLTAVLKAFNPSPQTGGPATVTAVRVNPALQSTYSILGFGSTPVINLTSVDYGVYTTGINVSISNGSVQGFMTTVALGNNFYTQDNIYNALMSIQYTGGQASATMTVNTAGTQLVLDAPAGTAVATLVLATLGNIGAVVAAINAVAGFTASILGNNANTPALNGFDSVTAIDVKTAPYIATGDLAAVIAWFNSGVQPLVTAAVASSGFAPAPVTAAYLTGGVDGSITNTNWSNGYSALQTADVQWVVPASSSTSIIAMNDAHCQFMSSVGQSERRGICGMALNTSDAAAEAEAFALNSDRTGLVHIGHYDYNLQGVLTLYPAYFTAALIAGGFAGSSPGTPMTNKTLTMQGLERVLQIPTQTDPLINGGVLPIAKTLAGFKCIQSCSTWLSNDNFNRVELSCGAAVDYTARSVRAALDPLRGQGNSPSLLAQGASITESTLRQLATPAPTGPGVLVGNAASPAYKNIQVSITGDVMRVQFQASPVIPNNYILITIYAVPFSGSISA